LRSKTYINYKKLKAKLKNKRVDFIYIAYGNQIPGSNSAVKIVFFLMNTSWTKSQNKLSLNTDEQLLSLKQI